MWIVFKSFKFWREFDESAEIGNTAENLIFSKHLQNIRYFNKNYGKKTIQSTVKLHCGKERTDFIRIKNTKYTGFLIFIGSVSLRECLRRCVDVEQSSGFCRALEYHDQSRECYMVIDEFDETTSTMPSDEFDLYEPICFDSSIEHSCPGDYIFTKVPNINIAKERSEITKGVKGINFLNIFISKMVF